MRRMEPISDGRSSKAAPRYQLVKVLWYFTVMENHRTAPRKRVLKAGEIEFGAGAIDCTVRNLSETGAALSVESPVGIPAEFNLITVSDHMNRRCRVVWRKENRIGITFA